MSVLAHFLGFWLEYVIERQAILFHELEYLGYGLLFGHGVAPKMNAAVTAGIMNISTTRATPMHT